MTVEANIVDRTVLRVTGADAETFLQGQLSQDVTAGPGLALLLEPTGKVCALLRFRRDDDGSYQLDTDAAAGDAVLARLRRFVLRVDVTIEPVEGWTGLRVFGAPPLVRAEPVAVWPTDGPQDVLTPDPVSEAAIIGAELLDDVDAERRRIAAGVPVSGVDIGPDTIPAEAGAWVIERAVSFTKGCYTGQELVARIDSRGGNVPRPLRGIRADGELQPGMEVVAGDKAVGRVTSAAGYLGLGPVARAVEPLTGVTVRGESVDLAATVEALPLPESASR